MESASRFSNDGLRRIGSGTVIYPKSPDAIDVDINLDLTYDRKDSVVVSSRLVKFVEPTSQQRSASQEHKLELCFSGDKPVGNPLTCIQTRSQSQEKYRKTTTRSSSPSSVRSNTASSYSASREHQSKVADDHVENVTAALSLSHTVEVPHQRIPQNFSISIERSNADAIDTNPNPNHRSTSSPSRNSNSKFRSVSNTSTTNTIRREKRLIQETKAASIRLGLEPSMGNSDDDDESASVLNLNRRPILDTPIIQYVPFETTHEVTVFLGENHRSQTRSQSQDKYLRVSRTRSNSPSSVRNNTVSSYSATREHQSKVADNHVENVSTKNNYDPSGVTRSLSSGSRHQHENKTSVIERIQCPGIIIQNSELDIESLTGKSDNSLPSCHSVIPKICHLSQASKSPTPHSPISPRRPHSEGFYMNPEDEHHHQMFESHEVTVPVTSEINIYGIPDSHISSSVSNEVSTSKLKEELCIQTGRNITMKPQLAYDFTSETTLKKIIKRAQEFFGVVKNRTLYSYDKYSYTSTTSLEKGAHNTKALFQEMVRVIENWRVAMTRELSQSVTTGHNMPGTLSTLTSGGSITTLSQLILREILHDETMGNIMGSKFIDPQISGTSASVADSYVSYKGEHSSDVSSLQPEYSDLTVVPYLHNEVAKYKTLVHTLARLDTKESSHTPLNLDQAFMHLRKDNDTHDKRDNRRDIYEWTAVPRPDEKRRYNGNKDGNNQLKGFLMFDAYNCRRKTAHGVNQKNVRHMIQEGYIDELDCEDANSCAFFITRRTNFLTSIGDEESNKLSDDNQTSKIPRLPIPLQFTKVLIILGFPQQCPLHVLLSSLEGDYGIPVLSVYRCGPSTHVHNMLAGMIFITAACNEAAVSSADAEPYDYDGGTKISIGEKTVSHLERLISNGSGNLAGIVAQGSVSVKVPSMFSHNVNNKKRSYNISRSAFINCSVLRCCSSTAALCVGEMLSFIHHRVEKRLLSVLGEVAGDNGFQNPTDEGTNARDTNEETPDINHSQVSKFSSEFFSNVSSICREAYTALLTSDPPSVVIDTLMGRSVPVAAVAAAHPTSTTITIRQNRKKNDADAGYDTKEGEALMKLNKDVLIAQTVEPIGPLQFLMAFCHQLDKQIWKRYQTIESSRMEFAALAKKTEAAKMPKMGIHHHKDMDEVENQTMIDVVELSLRRLFHDIDVLERGNTILFSLLTDNIFYNNALMEAERSQQAVDDEENIQISNISIDNESDGNDTVAYNSSRQPSINNDVSKGPSMFPRWPKVKPRIHFYPVLEDVPSVNKKKVVKYTNEILDSPRDKKSDTVIPKKLPSPNSSRSPVTQWSKSQPEPHSRSLLQTKTHKDDDDDHKAIEECDNRSEALFDCFRKGAEIIQASQRQAVMSSQDDSIGRLLTAKLFSTVKDPSRDVSDVEILFLFGRVCEKMLNTTLAHAVDAQLNVFSRRVF